MTLSMHGFSTHKNELRKSGRKGVNRYFITPWAWNCIIDKAHDTGLEKVKKNSMNKIYPVGSYRLRHAVGYKTQKFKQSLIFRVPEHALALASRMHHRTLGPILSVFRMETRTEIRAETRTETDGNRWKRTETDWYRESSDVSQKSYRKPYWRSVSRRTTV